MTWFGIPQPRRPAPAAAPLAGFPPAGKEGAGERAGIEGVAEHVSLAMATAVLFALDACNLDGALAAHCARVASLCTGLATACGVGRPLAVQLARAARLHEVGRIGLAPRRAGKDGDDGALDGRRAHAAIGAHIVRRTEAELVAWLVEQQYADYASLRRRIHADPTRLLLAGILRVADVADVLDPRPGAAAETADWPRTVLVAGRGTRFHPAAVDAWLSLRRVPPR